MGPVKAAAIVAAGLFSTSATAGFYGDGKVLLTGGVVTIDGGGGGGITPWAVISGYGTRDEINGGLHYTFAYLPDYSLNSYGATVGFFDRFELSFTRSTLPTGGTFDTVGLLAAILPGAVGETGIKPFNTTIEMDVVGAKLRLFGDAIYTADSLIPQVAIGGYYKDNKNKDLLRTLQAAKSKDWEAYICMTKVYFPFSTLINLTGRYTNANQTGLTGFGFKDRIGPDQDTDDKKKFRFEASIATLVAKNTVFGGEYAKHGKNLNNVGVNVNGLDIGGITSALAELPLVNQLGVSTANLQNTLTQYEDDWYDLFFAYAPNKRISFVVAYAMLGNITLTPDQHGFYLSTHLTF
ncbi:MAG: DUF3034 family protein [Panacagrimonas sp.]